MANIRRYIGEQISLQNSSNNAAIDVSSTGALQVKFGTAQTVKLQIDGSSTATLHGLDSTSGSSLVVRGGTGSSSSGGSLNLFGGDGSAGSSTTGGAVNINPGISNRSSTGGSVTLTGGYNNHATGLGGTVTIQGGGTAGSGTAGTVIVRGGKSDSTGAAGKVELRYGNTAGGSVGFTVDAAGNLICGNAALATSATDGFLYIDTCAGAPSGTPTSATGRVPLIYDTTNNKLYLYNGAWKPISAPSEYDAGNSGTAKTIDWSNGDAQKLTLTGSVTLTLSNPLVGNAYVLKIATGVGSFTVTWPASVLWAGGTAPTITTTASKVDLINLYWDGTNYFGSYSQNY